MSTKLEPPPHINVVQLPAWRQWRLWFTHLYERLKDGPFKVKAYTVATLPDADKWADSSFSSIVYVSDESGGAVLAFSDGTNWRRVTDRNVVS